MYNYLSLSIAVICTIPLLACCADHYKQITVLPIVPVGTDIHGRWGRGGGAVIVRLTKVGGE